jgi:hypothetical protein
MHAHAEHPRFGSKRGDDSVVSDIGSAAHALVFGGAAVRYVESVTKRSGPEKGVASVPTDWSTKDAQEAQAAIRAAGDIPLLPHQRAQVEGIHDAALAALETLQGKSVQQEVTMCFQLEGVWCRGRADYLDERYDVDLKTVDNADPFEFLAYMSPKIVTQKALRSLGHKALGQPRTCVWLLVEREFPFAASFVALSPAKLALAEERVTWAAKRWGACLEANNFPGYRMDIHFAEPKPWEENDWSERKAARE